MNEPADILIVDDTPANLHLLSEILKTNGYKVRPVTGGAPALLAATSKSPDLILLDINMPDMNGFEVCERLKADCKLKEVPVLFISANGATKDKVKAFNCGGVDYITKPFQSEEVLARVKTHLQIQRQQRHLQESYDKLRELESLRDNLVHMIIHDMSTPISVINISLSMLGDFSGSKPNKSSAVVFQAASNSVQQLQDMVSHLLAVSRLEAGEMPLDKIECQLDQLINTTIQQRAFSNGGHAINVEAPTGIKVFCDQNIIQRVLGNLLGNALKFIPEMGEVKIAVSTCNGKARVCVTDNGPGIPAESHLRIFEKFGQVKSTGHRNLGTGLGLAFCRLAVEAHGGQIGVGSEPGKGSTFWFELPL